MSDSPGENGGRGRSTSQVAAMAARFGGAASSPSSADPDLVTSRIPPRPPTVATSPAIGMPLPVATPVGTQIATPVATPLASPATPSPVGAAQSAKPKMSLLEMAKANKAAGGAGASSSKPSSLMPALPLPTASLPSAPSCIASTSGEASPITRESTALGGSFRESSAAESTGTLKILLKKGVGLKAADLNGKSDPYVIVKCGGLEQRTKTIQKTLDPVWNETLDFTGSLQQFLRTGMLLKCFDRDFLTRDDPLGEASVSLGELRRKVHHEYELPLPTQGSLFFSVSWLPDQAQSLKSVAAAQLLISRMQAKKDSLPRTPPIVASPSAALPAAAVATPPALAKYPTSHSLASKVASLDMTLAAEEAAAEALANSLLGVLTVHMDKGVGLMAADSNGKSDPYVILTCGGQTKKTRVIKANTSPEWAEDVAFSEAPLGETKAKGLKLKVGSPHLSPP